MIPSPAEIGLPKQFTKWRPHQWRAIQDLERTQFRFHALVAQTGSGKSATYMAYLLRRGVFKPNSKLRALVLTSTKMQQDQLSRDFQSLGIVDIRGQANYPCEIAKGLSVDEGPCHSGTQCDLKRGGCAYYDRERAARAARCVISNYSKWMASSAYGTELGPFDIMVCDEAHAVPDELAQFLSVELSRDECSEYLYPLHDPPLTDWRSWAKAAEGQLGAIELSRADEHDRKQQRWIRRGIKLLSKLRRLATADETGWVGEGTRHGIRYDPINPGPYAEDFLFRKTPKIVLSSATIRARTLRLLNVPKDRFHVAEYPSILPVKRRPTYFVPTVRLTRNSTADELGVWLEMIDRIIKRRRDRKGIIHTVSYARARWIQERSQYSNLMVLHEPGRAAQGVEEFRRLPAPRVLLSPAVTTGLDFPYSQCEYQIICKIPFPDSRAAVLKARAKSDKSYFAYLAMLDLVQAAGRGMRATDDQCEVFILDAHWQWFARKYEAFAPKWFRESVRQVVTLPPPPAKLLVDAATTS